MKHDPRLFRETETHVQSNKRIAEHLRISPALRTDSSPGVFIELDHRRTVLSTADAISLASLIADTVADAKERASKL